MFYETLYFVDVVLYFKRYIYAIFPPISVSQLSVNQLYAIFPPISSVNQLYAIFPPIFGSI